LHENWELKKSLTSSVSSHDIDRWYQIARENGASGGKLLGAGGGGFLLFYADEGRHEAIERALKPLRRFDLGFEPLGSRIIFYNS
jgi:D-glycero-alpha-D-manno-heptose-7-phosphate kinase